MRRGVRLKGIKVVTKPNGKRFVYRRVKGGLVPLPDLPENDPKFLAAYVAAGEAQPKPKSRHAAGSIGALIVSYLKSDEYHSLADSTRAVRRRVLDKISQKGGAAKVVDLRPDHIRRDVRSLSPGAASNRLKAWRAIMGFAVEDGWITTNPAIGVKAPKGEVTPHHQWTPDEIQQFRNHWPQGTQQRTAFEVIYWTGARCVDAVRLGAQMVSGGWLSFVQAKTGGPATCPIATLPDWCAGLADDHAHFLTALPKSQMLWIMTQAGKPRSVKGLSQWISKSAKEAGLPTHCTAHGLRKARSAALAEGGATSHQIGAWTGHTSLSEIAHYTRSADQVRILTGTGRVQNLETVVEKFPK
ncbi:MAG: tyrosine-type recombinase/integrase [Planktomarina sp.]